MLGDKQQQTTEGGSTALQAGRDINYHGLSVAEVRELCSLFLRDNFPQLQAEARQAAEQHVRAFAEGLENRLAENAASIAFERFCEPDVQAAINDAVQASARRGDAANPDILTTLIMERVSKSPSNYKDIVLSEAVHVVPKLTGQQVSLISFVHFVRSIVFQGLPNIGGLEQIGTIGMNLSTPGFGMSASQKQHIQYAGAASVNNVMGGDIFDIMRQEYKVFDFRDGPSFKEALKTQAPSYLKLLEQYTTDNLFEVNLTSVGQAIAIAHISGFVGKLDYTIWLK